MLESKFQSELIKELHMLYPDALILKNDSSYIQGIPDLTVLGPNGHWAVLECKRSRREFAYDKQPNQAYYISRANNIGGYGAFIYPENKEEVLNGIQSAFSDRR